MEGPTRKGASIDPPAHGHHGATRPPSSSAAEKDPVCGMNVDPAKAAARHEHAGRTYVFCCEGCRTKFAADPDRYLPTGAERSPGPGGGARGSSLLQMA